MNEKRVKELVAELAFELSVVGESVPPAVKVTKHMLIEQELKAIQEYAASTPNGVTKTDVAKKFKLGKNTAYGRLLVLYKQGKLVKTIEPFSYQEKQLKVSRFKKQ